MDGKFAPVSETVDEGVVVQQTEGTTEHDQNEEISCDTGNNVMVVTLSTAYRRHIEDGDTFGDLFASCSTNSNPLLRPAATS